MTLRNTLKILSESLNDEKLEKQYKQKLSSFEKTMKEKFDFTVPKDFKINIELNGNANPAQIKQAIKDAGYSAAEARELEKLLWTWSNYYSQWYKNIRADNMGGKWTPPEDPEPSASDPKTEEQLANEVVSSLADVKRRINKINITNSPDLYDNDEPIKYLVEQVRKLQAKYKEFKKLRNKM